MPRSDDPPGGLGRERGRPGCRRGRDRRVRGGDHGHVHRADRARHTGGYQIKGEWLERNATTITAIVLIAIGIVAYIGF
jgi:hypothetical protein